MTPYFMVAKGHKIYKVTERLFIDNWHQISLWPKATTFIKLQRGYSLTNGTTFHCGQRPQFGHNIYKFFIFFWFGNWNMFYDFHKIWFIDTLYREAFHWQVTPHFIVAKDHNLATTFIKLQRGYSLTNDTTFHCGQRPSLATTFIKSIFFWVWKLEHVLWFS